MRVFVLCTGRNGSVTFSKACEAMTNFTSGHESKSTLLGMKRFEFPDQHIEVDNRLSWQLGHLHELHSDDVFYVHLTRNHKDVAKSFQKRFFSQRSIVLNFALGIKKMSPKELTRTVQLKISEDYIETVTKNVMHFLSDKDHMTIDLSELEEKFSEFWNRIGATGDLDQGLSTIRSIHNPSRTKQFNFIIRLKNYVYTEFRALFS